MTTTPNDTNLIPCSVCHGSSKCRVCDGQATYEVPQIFEYKPLIVDCEECGGSGKCYNCAGRGFFDLPFSDLGKPNPDEDWEDLL